MSFKKIVIGLLTLWLGLMGIAFGMLFLVCVILYLFWQGLSVSVIAFGLLCMSFLVLAGLVLWHSGSRETAKMTDTEPKLNGAEPLYLTEADRLPYEMQRQLGSVTRYGNE